MHPADPMTPSESKSSRRSSVLRTLAFALAAAWVCGAAALAQAPYAQVPYTQAGDARSGYAPPTREAEHAYPVQPPLHVDAQVQPAGWPIPGFGGSAGEDPLKEKHDGRKLELRGGAAASPGAPAAKSGAAQAGGLLKDWFGAGGAEQAVKLFILSGVVSLAPALLMMTTCFVRLAVVLGMLRQALGGPPGLPNQVLTALAVFLTALVMWPVWSDVQRNALAPLSREEIDFDEAWRRAEKPLRRFMSLQIERTGNQADVWLFLRHWPEAREPKTYDDVPMAVLAPAFLLSELKTAFLIGFQIFLPFLVIDLVVAAATTSLGMLMLSPSSISLPIKILLFVVADGWNLVVGMLLASFEAYSP